MSEIAFIRTKDTVKDRNISPFKTVKLHSNDLISIKDTKSEIAHLLKLNIDEVLPDHKCEQHVVLKHHSLRSILNISASCPYDYRSSG